MINARSVHNKIDKINEYLLRENVLFLALTETWLQPEDDQLCKELTPDGYAFIHMPRRERKGGGVTFVCHQGAKPKSLLIGNYTSFEHTAVSLTVNSNSLMFLVIYRPPNSPTQVFVDELYSLLEDIVVSYDKFVISGDLNFHISDRTNPTTKQFLDILEAFDLSQHVNVATHVGGLVSV